MSQDEDGSKGPRASSGINVAYVELQMAKALATAKTHTDKPTRERARRRAAKWRGVVDGIFSGRLDIGSRSPIDGVPVWVTPEVLMGGFASGALPAGGPLQAHELELLASIDGIPPGEERSALNAFFLTEQGLAILREQLDSGLFRILVPEEGALLVVAWLVEQQLHLTARTIVDEISPFFSRLRFYPAPVDRAPAISVEVQLETAGEGIGKLQKLRTPARLLAQQEDVRIWAPIYDQMIVLLMETIEDSWPFQRYPKDWPERVLALEAKIQMLEKEHSHSAGLKRPARQATQLRNLLLKGAAAPQSLSGQEVGRAGRIFEGFKAKWGIPFSPEHTEKRRRQLLDFSRPGRGEQASVMIRRLEGCPKPIGIAEIERFLQPIQAEEVENSRWVGLTFLPSIIRKVHRCQRATIEILVERGILKSGECLARVVPQITSGLRAAEFDDSRLGRAYAEIYRAFRQRRSLILFNFYRQAQLEELPWVAAIESLRHQGDASRHGARQVMRDISLLTLRAYPQTIVPNKLLQELKALAKDGGLEIPLVEELATDIFMRDFVGKYRDAAVAAADLLEGTLYERYFGIDFGRIRALRPPAADLENDYGSSRDFTRLCTSRAGTHGGNPALNGMIIEQQQVLTTQNLAALVGALDLRSTLEHELVELARKCFSWICSRLQRKPRRRHEALISLKVSAYAWRQMVFFLALAPASELPAFLGWAKGHLLTQPEEFQARFAPALDGLALAAGTGNPNAESAKSWRQFLGWTSSRHWLLQDAPGTR